MPPDNPALPPEWTYQANVAGTAAAITVPAPSSPVSHVVTSVEVELLDTGAGALFNPQLLVVDVVTTIILFSRLLLDLAPAGTIDRPATVATGPFVGSPGGAILVQMTLGLAGVEQNLTIRGYDV